MDRKRKIIELAKQMGLIRPRDVEAAGIHREYLLRLYRNGDLTRVGRGLYALPDGQTSEFLPLAEVAKRVPNAVVCLFSALEFHNLTNKDRLCESSEPQSYPVVGRARHVGQGLFIGKYLFLNGMRFKPGLGQCFL